METTRSASQTPRTGFPLFAKIIGWLLLNLFLLGLIFYSLLQFQFKLGINSLIAGPAGDRIQSLSLAISGALRESTPEEWNQILKNFSTAYKVQLTLLGPNGAYLAGSPEAVPPEVVAKATERRGPGEGLGKGPPPGRGARLELATPRMAVENPPVPHTLFGLRTTEPTRYWVGVRIAAPEPRPSAPRRPVALTLLLATDSLYSGTLFLDLKLWIVAGLGTLLLSVLLWIPPVRGLTQALSQLTRATDTIANGDFSVRVNTRRKDEVGHLGNSINRMADRLDGFVKGQKRFLGDIAHELCSPAARIQIGIGILEQNASPQQQQALEDVREEVEEMSGLINELLSFSKASLGKTEGSLELVPLAATVRQVIQREDLTSEEVRVQIDESLVALGRADLLRRALANLVRNAKRYAGAAGPIEITAEPVQDAICLAVSDNGTGVPEPELQRIFDPFYRAEPSRSRDTGGAGLGLAIVKSCVEACGGSVRAKNLEPQGFQVAITLKAAHGQIKDA